MKYQIHYKDMDKPLAIESYIEKKLRKLAKFDWIQDEVKIELRRYDKENTYKASMVVFPNHANTIDAEARADNLNTAITLVVNKVVTQLVKIKETAAGYTK